MIVLSSAKLPVNCIDKTMVKIDATEGDQLWSDYQIKRHTELNP